MEDKKFWSHESWSSNSTKECKTEHLGAINDDSQVLCLTFLNMFIIDYDGIIAYDILIDCVRMNRNFVLANSSKRNSYSYGIHTDSYYVRQRTYFFL